MGAVIAIDALVEQRRIWKGRPPPRPAEGQPTGHAALDAVLPAGGWPEGALSEILVPADGVGELRLQVAAEAGRTLGLATRPLVAARNPSPAALRIVIDAHPAQLRVLKCRGGLAPPQPIPFGDASFGDAPFGDAPSNGAPARNGAAIHRIGRKG